MQTIIIKLYPEKLENADLDLRYRYRYRIPDRIEEISNGLIQGRRKEFSSHLWCDI